MTLPSQLLSKKFPEISQEWHPTRNGNLTPDNVSFGSGKKVWWLCNKGHEWQAHINNRTRGAGCPFCSGRYATSQNNLLITHPSIAREWHTPKNNGQVSSNFPPGSHYKAWWKCAKGHIWQAVIKNRTLGRGCPFCAGKKATPKNNLKYLYPEVADQWHPAKNNDLLPQDFKPQSNIKVWWLCNNGHEWAARIQDRTIGKNSCPYCSKQTSQLEIRLYCELKAIFSDVRWREKIDGFEIDIFLRDYDIAIEVDGYYWHKNREKVELKKQKSIESNQIILVRIRENPLKKLSSYDVLFDQKETDKQIIKSLLTSLKGLITSKDQKEIISYLKEGVFRNKKEFRKILSYIPGPPPDQSLASLNPQISSEWNYKKNNPLKPNMFSLASNKKVWWVCPKGHEWKAVIYSRVAGRGCPYCSGRFATIQNNLYMKRPDLVNEWHPVKNKLLSPQDVKPFSHHKVWWKCPEGHEWLTTVANRSKSKGCPYCAGRKKLDINQMKDIAKSRNGKCLSKIYVNARSKLLWQCSEGHQWEAKPDSIKKGTWCPKCGAKKAWAKRRLDS